MRSGLLRGVYKYTYVICVLIYFIKVYIVGTHLNYLDKFIKAYVVALIWIASTCWGNLNEYQDKIFRRKRLSTGANFVHIYIEIWDVYTKI